MNTRSARSPDDLRRLVSLATAGDGDGGSPHEELMDVFLPLVLRVVRTGRGPTALVRWVGQQTVGPKRRQGSDRLTRELTHRLVRLLCPPADPLSDTVVGGCPTTTNPRRDRGPLRSAKRGKRER
ncbi:hypothetical protein [Fimbriiglobus ruber]|nr:hypothetical protein [Fimbriiglobus ruber]